MPRAKVTCTQCDRPEWQSYVRNGICRDCARVNFEEYVAEVAGGVPHSVEGRKTGSPRKRRPRINTASEFAYVPVCSFCKRSVKDVTYLVEASEDNHSVYICDRCVDVCSQMVFSEIRRRPDQDNTELSELPSPLPRSRP